MTTIDLTTTPVRGMQAGRMPAGFRLAALTRGLFALDTRGDPIPVEDRALGIDTSKWNGVMNWQTAYNAGARFAFMKATQGTNIADAQFPVSRTNIGTLMPWGAYHYLINTDGTNQANWFCDTVGDNWGKLPPVVDVELPSVDSAIIYQYAYRINARLGLYPMIYTSAYFWSLVTGGYKSWLTSHCLLWAAHWGTLAPLLPTGWTNYAVHQWSADGNGRGREFGAPPGADVDMDLDYARISWLESFSPSPAPDDHTVLAALSRYARTELGYTGPIAE